MSKSYFLMKSEPDVWSIEQQKKSPNNQILAFAIAYNNLMKSICDSVEERHDEEKIYSVLKQLSEIPEINKANFFAQDAQVYEILTLLSKPSFCSKFKLDSELPLEYNNSEFKKLPIKGSDAKDLSNFLRFIFLVFIKFYLLY